MKKKTEKKPYYSIEEYKNYKNLTLGFVKFPKFSGRVYMASFKDQGYTNLSVAFNEKSFAHTTERFIQKKFGSYLAVSVYIGEIVSLPEFEKVKVNKHRVKEFFSSMKSDLEYRVKEYYENFNCLPAGVVEIPKKKSTQQSFELSIYDEKSGDFKDVFCEAVDKKTFKTFMEKIVKDEDCHLHCRFEQEQTDIQETLNEYSLPISAREATKEETENSLNVVSNCGWDGALGVQNWSAESSTNVNSVPYFYFVSDTKEKTKALVSAFETHFRSLIDSLCQEKQKEENLEREERKREVNEENKTKKEKLKKFFDEV